MFEVHRIALDLFLRNGYATTTVEELAQAAGVSQSTFFRYFPQKEDVVSFAYENLGANHSAFVFRGNIDHALQALEDNFANQFERMTEPAANTFARLQLLLEKEPALRASMHERIDRDFDQLREALTEVLGDAHDLNIRIVLRVAGGTVHAAIDTWLAGDIHTVSLAQTYRDARAALRRVTRTLR